MNNEKLNSVNPNANSHYRQKKNAEEMKHQVITFALMIFLTLISFVAVAYDGFSSWFTIPFILLIIIPDGFAVIMVRFLKLLMPVHPGTLLI